jgi:uncharacterized DUF497 family protein
LGGFDWDEENVDHIARHGVTPAEVEEVLTRKRITSEPYFVNNEERRVVQGITEGGRPLTVVITDRNRLTRPITAHDMSRRDRRQYGPQLF